MYCQPLSLSLSLSDSNLFSDDFIGFLSCRCKFACVFLISGCGTCVVACTYGILPFSRFCLFRTLNSLYSWSHGQIGAGGVASCVLVSSSHHAAGWWSSHHYCLSCCCVLLSYVVIYLSLLMSCRKRQRKKRFDLSASADPEALTSLEPNGRVRFEQSDFHCPTNLSH